jgi:glyoxylase-like metal-dependent hydrolase (beta-lactamase superfamily II)
LQEKLGPIVFQLPLNFTAVQDRTGLGRSLLKAMALRGRRGRFQIEVSCFAGGASPNQASQRVWRGARRWRFSRLTSEKVGDGVYLILGGYAALAVDMGNHIIVVEGPQNDVRANAIIAEAKKLIPNKPITEFVNTHAHFDHAGGLRAFVAEGATIIGVIDSLLKSGKANRFQRGPVEHRGRQGSRI